MTILKSVVAIVGVLAVTGWTVPALAADSLEAIANGAHRSAENKARNAARHPVETMEFFGLTPSSTVVELTPAGGWYTEVIAPYVNEHGKYYGANFDRQAEIEFMQRMNAAYKAKLDANPEIYGNAVITDLAMDEREIAPAGSADLVVGFRNLHDWIGREYTTVIIGKVVAALKPGGVFGVVEAREKMDRPQNLTEHVGYTREDYAIAQIEAAGLVFVGSSEVNANPRDTKDWERGAFGIPKGIGESDRFTLKFIKPE